MAGTPPFADRHGPIGQAWYMSGPVIAIGVFCASYISWRPADILFTVSDAFFVLGAGMLLAAHRAPMQPFGRMTGWWLVATLILLIGLFIGSLLNGNPDRWLIGGAQYCFSLIVLPCLLMNHGDQRTLMLAKALVAGVTAMEAFGIAAYWGLDLSYEGYSRISHDFVTGAGRLGAFLGDANWNSAMIVTAWPFALYLHIRRKIGPVTFYLSTIILLIGLILAASVTGMVSALMSLAIFTVVSGRLPSYRFFLTGALTGSLLFAVGFQLPRAFEKRIAPAVEQNDVTMAGTYSGRMKLIEEAWGMVDNTALVGVGLDQYRKVSVDKAPVHNIYLLLWAEGGLLALAGWLMLNGIMLFGAFAAYRKDRLAAALAMAVLSTFIIFSNAAPHLYARSWLVPIMLGIAPAFARIADEPAWRRRARKAKAVSIQRGRA